MIIWNSSSILLRNEVQTLPSRTFLEKVAESKMKRQKCCPLKYAYETLGRNYPVTTFFENRRFSSVFFCKRNNDIHYSERCFLKGQLDFNGLKVLNSYSVEPWNLLVCLPEPTTNLFTILLWIRNSSSLLLPQHWRSLSDSNEIFDVSFLSLSFLIFALSFRIFCTKCLRQSRLKTVLVTENLLYSKTLRLDNLLPGSSSRTVMKASLSTKNDVYLCSSFFFHPKLLISRVLRDNLIVELPEPLFSQLRNLQQL